MLQVNLLVVNFNPIKYSLLNRITRASIHMIIHVNQLLSTVLIFEYYVKYDVCLRCDL